MGARFTAATTIKDSFCAPCAPGSYGPADGSADCLIQPTCGNQLATTGDAGCTVAVPRGTGLDSVTAVGSCAACVDGTFGVNGAAHCAANAVCGKQVGGATRVNAVATREVAGTCNACAADTWALNIGDDCVANTVCGFAVGTAGAKRASDASRTVAGTCANCAANSFDATTAFNGNCVAQTVAGTCTKNLLAGGARFTAATPTKDSFCAPCVGGSYGPADGSADCLIHTPCGNQLATTGALCAADSRLTGATETAAGTCAACAADTYGVNGAATCAANAVCGKQVGGATRVNAAATREVIGTCNACAADTWALNIGDDCVANTVCGFAVGTSGAKRASDASRTVAGTCANCA